LNGGEDDDDDGRGFPFTAYSDTPLQSTLWPKPTGMKRVGSKIYYVVLVTR